MHIFAAQTNSLFFQLLITGFAAVLQEQWKFGEALPATTHDHLDDILLSRHHRTVNIESLYKKWKNRTIFYYLDSSYSAEESSLIRRAIVKVTQDLRQCVSFRAVSSTDPQFKVKITPYQAAPYSHQPEALCYSYPGYVENLNRGGVKEQRVSVVRGPHGCLPADGKLRGVMKQLAILLGKRNEHQRGDRDEHLTMHTENVLMESAYRIYSGSEAYWSAFPYDYQSITHNQPSDFAKPGKTAFTVKGHLNVISSADQLSVSDCKLISMMYGCDPSLCASPVQLATIAPPVDGNNNEDSSEENHQGEKEHHWGYQVHSSTDEIAPSDWSKVSPACGAAHQSPILISRNNFTIKQELRQLNMANYNEVPIGEKWVVVNNGHSVQFTAAFADIPRLQGGSLVASYDFIQFHFHWGSEDSRGSEHVVDGETFPIELHIVHRKIHETNEMALQDATGLAVLGIVFRLANASQQPARYKRHLDTMVSAVQQVKKPMVPVTVHLPEFDLQDLIPHIVQYYRYSGSLTAPPCAEVVVWSVIKEPLLISKDQLNVFRSLRGRNGQEINNFRPLQNANGRPIFLYPG